MISDSTNHKYLQNPAACTTVVAKLHKFSISIGSMSPCVLEIMQYARKHNHILSVVHGNALMEIFEIRHNDGITKNKRSTNKDGQCS